MTNMDSAHPHRFGPGERVMCRECRAFKVPDVDDFGDLWCAECGELMVCDECGQPLVMAGKDGGE